MKFECDKCQTRYNISDDKVKGKVLKIRCKTCQNIIEVRESSALNSDESAPFSSPFKVAKDSAEWFVAIKGEQHGPMSKSEVKQFYRDKKIHSRSYCWHEDLSEWTRFKELPDFQECLNEEKSDHAAQKPAVPVLPSSASKAQPKSPKKASSPLSDPFAAAAKKGVSLPPVAEGAPRESTRVFIMNAGLHNRDKKHKAYAIAAISITLAIITLGYLDYTGLYRIPFMSAVALKVAEKMGDEKAINMYKLREIDDLEGIISEVEQLALRCKLTGETCPEPKKVRRARNKRTGKKTENLDLGSAFQTGGSEKDGIARRNGAIADLELTGNPLKDAQRKKLGLARDKGPKTPNIGNRLKGNEIGVGGTDLTAAQISKVIKANKNSIRVCIQKAAKSGSEINGKRYIKVIVKPDGKVKFAKVTDGLTAAAPVGECLARAARKWRFPPASSESEFDVPLILTTTF